MTDKNPNYCNYRLSDLLIPGSLGEDPLGQLLQVILQNHAALLEAQGRIGRQGRNICGLSAILNGTIAYCDHPFNNHTNCPRILDESPR